MYTILIAVCAYSSVALLAYLQHALRVGLFSRALGLAVACVVQADLALLANAAIMDVHAEANSALDCIRYIAACLCSAALSTYLIALTLED